jgi:hypothetical protein
MPFQRERKLESVVSQRSFRYTKDATPLSKYRVEFQVEYWKTSYTELYFSTEFINYTNPINIYTEFVVKIVILVHNSYRLPVNTILSTNFPST